MSFQLYFGDAIDMMRSLPSASIDMIDTDVAYESLEKHRATGTTTRLKQSDASSNEWFEIFRNARFPEFFEEAYRVLKKDTHLYFFCDGETSRVAIPIAEAAGFTFWNELVWVKTKGISSPETLEKTDLKIGMGYHFRRCKEYVLFFEKGKRKLHDLGIGDVLPFPPVRNGYPTEKPVDLHKVLIGQSTEPGDTVLDPFMGSASAGIAAEKLKRNFIGGDLKRSAVVEAQERLKKAGGQALGEPIAVAASEHVVAIVAEEKARAEAKANRPKRTKKAATPTVSVEPEPELEGQTGAIVALMESEPAAESAEVIPIGPYFTPEIKEALADVVQLDGAFMTGPLPGGPTRHLTRPEVVMPPRPALCPHGDPRSACILCRARR